MANYYIAIPLGLGTEHMTLKYLGQLSDFEVEQWKQKMEALSNIQKFPVSSEGLGILGRQRPYLVDYIKRNPRLNASFGVFDNLSAPAHVTNRVIVPETTGAIDQMNTVLADKVNMYKVDAGKHEIVHTVEFRKRRPSTWIMDQLGLSKFGEQMYKESSAASLLEAGIGGYGAYLASKKLLPPKEPVVTNGKWEYPGADYRPAAIAGVGAIVSPILGRRLRARALAKLISSRGKTLRSQGLVQDRSMNRLYDMRNKLRQNGNLDILGVHRSSNANEIYDQALSPEINNLLADKLQVRRINRIYNRSLKAHRVLPFGLGTGISRESAETLARPFKRHHSRSGLGLSNDSKLLDSTKRRYVYDAIVGDGVNDYDSFKSRMRTLLDSLP